MIKIKLDPLFTEAYSPLTLSVVGQAITVNGEEFDFSPLPMGMLLPPESIDSGWFAGPVAKDRAGVLHITLRFPHPVDAPDDMKHPAPIIIIEDGPVALPKYVPVIVEELPIPEEPEDEYQFPDSYTRHYD